MTMTDILTMLPIGLIVLTKDNTEVAFSSKETNSIFGVEEDENCKSNLLQKIHKCDLLNKKERLLALDGKNYLVNIITGNDSSIIISLTNVTALHELSLIKLESSLKTNLMQTLRHEIRTPLTGIVGLIETLKKNIKSKLDFEGMKLVDVIQYSCNLISNLLNNFTVHTL